MTALATISAVLPTSMRPLSGSVVVRSRRRRRSAARLHAIQFRRAAIALAGRGDIAGARHARACSDALRGAV